MTITKEDIEIFKSSKLKGWITKGSMKRLARAYNKYVEKDNQIKNCMCNKINRKIYHNIIFEWYDENSN
jgi:hypothetical protein